MFVDSHCHLDFPELRNNLDAISAAMDENQVTHALCISVELPTCANEMSRSAAISSATCFT